MKLRFILLSERERSLILIRKRLNVVHPSEAIKGSFNHSTNASPINNYI